MLCYTILHYTILYYTILYYTTLHNTILLLLFLFPFPRRTSYLSSYISYFKSVRHNLKISYWQNVYNCWCKYKQLYVGGCVCALCSVCTPSVTTSSWMAHQVPPLSQQLNTDIMYSLFITAYSVTMTNKQMNTLPTHVIIFRFWYI